VTSPSYPITLANDMSTSVTISIASHGYEATFDIDANGNATVPGASGDEVTEVGVGMDDIVRCYEWLCHNRYDPASRQPPSREGIMTVRHLGQEIEFAFERTLIDTADNPVDSLINRLGESLPLLIDMSNVDV